ncbi:MAG: diacylglycerol/lipid kinase family protein [Limisphaerales bacterium]
MRVCVIFNPADRGEKAKRLRRHLDDLGASATLRPTAAAGEGRKLAAEAVEEGFEVIVAAGGDGTLNEVLNGIGDVPEGFARTRLGVLPLGTVNVFAKELGIPSDVRRAWEAIQRGREMAIDLPEVESGAEGARQRRHFAQMAGAGLDARAVDLVSWELKKKIGLFAYVAAFLEALREPHPQITYTDGSRTATGELILVGNGRYYGGRFQLFPEADMRDGRLGVFILPCVNWAVVLRCGLALLTGRLHRLKAAQHFRVDTFQLTADRLARLELDGEARGNLPATFAVQPRALHVIVP